MTKVTMPEPGYKISAKYGEFTSFTSSDPRAKKGDGLYTAEQTEAYKDACVREALEKAIAICDAAYEQGDGEYRDSGCNPYFEGGRDAAESIETKIRALIPQHDNE